VWKLDDPAVLTAERAEKAAVAAEAARRKLNMALDKKVTIVGSQLSPPAKRPVDGNMSAGCTVCAQQELKKNSVLCPVGSANWMIMPALGRGCARQMRCSGFRG
jgi:hypothetical protein